MQFIGLSDMCDLIMGAGDIVSAICEKYKDESVTDDTVVKMENEVEEKLKKYNEAFSVIGIRFIAMIRIDSELNCIMVNACFVSSVCHGIAIEEKR